MLNHYSTKQISPVLVNEVVSALKAVGGYGSIEIYVQNSTVTQISVRNIKKTAATGGERLSQQPKTRTTISLVTGTKSPVEG